MIENKLGFKWQKVQKNTCALAWSKKWKKLQEAMYNSLTSKVWKILTFKMKLLFNLSWTKILKKTFFYSDHANKHAHCFVYHCFDFVSSEFKWIIDKIFSISLYLLAWSSIEWVYMKSESKSTNNTIKVGEAIQTPTFFHSQ